MATSNHSTVGFNFSEKIYYHLLRILGTGLVKSPDFVPHSICIAIGRLIYYMGGKRRRILLRNLHHSYPNLSESDRRKMAKRSCQQTVELGLLSMVSPWASREWITNRFSIAPEYRPLFKQYINEPDQSVVLLIPHLSLTEAICFAPLFLDKIEREVGVIYRPFRNRVMEYLVKRGRERWGISLLSRKEGFLQASQILRDKGIICILFDQNAGHHGSLCSFMGRIASATELPALLAYKHHSHVLCTWIQRHGFWRGSLQMELAPVQDTSVAGYTLAAQQWLERMLYQKDMDSASWLWLHNRWRTQDEAAYRFQLRAKKILQVPNPQKDPQRATRFWVRLPNWLGDIVMTLPLLRAMQQGRPDVHWTLFAPPATVELLQRFMPQMEIRALPPKGWARFRYFLRSRFEYPDLFLLFTHSLRSDIEAWLTRAKDRYGLTFPGKKRRLLTHTYPSPHPRNPEDVHQFQVWTEFIRHFGLQEDTNLSPFKDLFANRRDSQSPLHIGLVCGTENSPEKRWPIHSFAQLLRALHKQFPTARFSLFGTAKDRAITDQVAEQCGLSSDIVHNVAGKTSLIEFGQMLSQTTLLIGNDTGGMHLANALGIPTIVLFGPTNPLRTGPIYNTPHIVLQPDNALPQGGANIEEITPQMVMQCVHSLLEDALTTSAVSD
jgi:heptosyltransferase-2